MTEADNSLALFSINQAAKELKVGKKRIYEMLDKGEIGIIEFSNKTLKIPKTELTRWVQERIKFSVIRKTSDDGVMTRKAPAFDAQSVINKIIKGKGIDEQKQK